TQIQELRDEIRYLEQEKASMEEELQSFIENELPPLKNLDGSYKNNVRACFQDLVLSGVGIKETKNVIKSVLINLANINVENNDLPGATFARSQYAEARLLAMMQLGTTLVHDFEKSDCTLQSDGTSKFGKHYGTYDISCKSGENMVLGLRGMACGDAETQLSVFKEIIDEIELVCNGSTTNIAQKILASIKNTMSDRHIVQKKFNKLLQEYRSEILPNVIEGWNSLSEVDQNKMKSINNYFCGLHYMVGLADQSEGTLKVFEKLLYDEKLVGSLAHGGYSNGGESGTLRLIRTLCKAVQERGCEKSGRMVEFQLALEDSGLPENPLIPFKGNRFNVLFYNAGMIYYLHDKCKSFFDDVFEENRLLSAVYHDLGEPAYIIGCRALGLVNKFLTGPLWRLLVKIKNILELNEYYQRIEQLSQQISNDASEFLSGNVIFFEEFEDSLMSKDDIYYKLLEPSEKYDHLTKQLLEILFASFAMITNRMIGDHLKDGKYDKPSSALIAQSESVPNTNVYPESNFGCLDRLIREKPNANEITLEAIIMCKSNNTQQWRDKLSKNEKDHWMNWAKNLRKVHHKQFLEKRKKIRKLRNERRLNKIDNKKRKEIKLRAIKEGLCKDIEQYGGLWKSNDDVDLNLKKLTEARKIDALKCQLKFRQKVLLENSIVDSSLFYFSSKKNVFSSSVLKENLKDIIRSVGNIEIEKDFTTAGAEDTLLNVPIEKMNKEKDRLQLLILSEKDKINDHKSNEAPKSKKQKINCSYNKPNKKKINCVNTGLENVPAVSNKSELIGKCVSHFTMDDEGNPKWYSGTVVCCKPNTDSEMVIRYDNYPTLYSFDFDEYTSGLLKLLPLDPEFAVGKFILHKFYDEEEVDDWWENGKIISYEPATDLYTINYFHAEEDYAFQNEEDVDVYETLIIPMEEDYLNNEIKFL
ncbi:MAG: hypothetical protein MK231_04815, partial [Pelagibacterales bacterium]|nr:hypothetical protein [Pelagibacterales bacterium]